MSDDPELFRTLAEVEAKPIDWFWPPYVPYEMITIIEGDPGIGKSYLAMHLAAQTSIGGTLPGGETLARGRVLYLTAEDDPAYTLRPRIEAMGGDAKRIRFVDGFVTFDEDGLEKIAAEVKRKRPDLIIVDTLFAFVPTDRDPFKPNDIRAVLSAVGRIASTCGAAVLIIRHWTKDTRGKALYRGSGSIDIMAVARSALTVVVHPENPDLRVVAHVKHNLSKRGASYLFELVQKEGQVQPILEWRGTTTLTADELQSGVLDEAKASDIAADFLRETLKDGPMPASQITVMSEARSISRRTLERAKEALGVESKKAGRAWVWSLPPE